MAQHQALAAGNWQKLSLADQLGNIGSEIGRALGARSKTDSHAALNRALELFDLSLADRRWYGRGSEIARAREVVCDFLVGDNVYNSTAQSLEDYFMQFALAARLRR